MFQRDTYRLIKNTLKRFLSLLLIVLIGVAFMMGLMSDPLILRNSVDVYNDEYRLHDLQLYSSYGFCEEDIQALRKQKNVKEIFASRFIDTYVDFKGVEFVARFEECYRDVDFYELVEGRLPEKRNEALLLNNASISRHALIGDSITVTGEADLNQKTFTVVGIVRSPAYTSKILGASNCDNQDLNMIFFIPNSNFSADYYTTVYLTLEDCDKEISYTSSYKETVKAKEEEIEYFAGEQEGYYRDKLVSQYEEELEENEKLFEEKKTEGERELEEAKKKLDDAQMELLVGKSQLETSRLTLEASRKELEANERLLAENEKTVNEAIAQVESQSGQSFDTFYQEVSAAYTTYITLESQKGNSGSYTNELIRRLNEEKANNLARIEEIDAELALLTEEDENYAALITEKDGLIARNDAIDRSIEGIGEITDENNIDELLTEMDQAMNGSVKNTYLQLTQLKQGKDQVEAGKSQLASARAQIESGEAALKAGQDQLASGERQYQSGLKEYEEGLMTFHDEIEKAETELRKAREDLEALPSASWMILDRDSHYSSYMYEATIKQMGAIGYALPVIFFLVAALVCMTTMTRLVDEQRSQIGIFRALGFSNRKIIGKYVSYALAASFLGSFFGIFLGQALFPTVIYTTWRLMYDLPPIKMSFPIGPLLISVLSFSVLMALVTTFVVNRSLKEMPAALMRPKPPKNAKEVFLEKITFIWKRLSFTSKITARNLIRYKSRFFMTVIGVAGCTGLLVVGFGIKDSISDIIQIQYGQIFNYDYQINLEDDHHLEEDLSILEENLDNEAVVPFMTYTTRAYLGKDEDTLTVQVMDPRQGNDILGLRETNLKDEIHFSNDGIILSHKFAINHDLKEGDMITIESQSGLKREVRIDKICEFYFQHYIFMSDACYKNLFEEEVHKTSIAIRSEHPDSLKKDTERLEGYVSTLDFTSLIAQFENMIEALDFIILVIIITAGSLAFVVLINLIEVNISERTREIATLKVLGFRPGEVNSYLFKEIILLSIIGGLLGLPLGVIEHHFIMNVINMEMIMFGMNISLFSFSVSFFITILFTLIVLFFTRKHLREIRMVESLKSVE